MENLAEQFEQHMDEIHSNLKDKIEKITIVINDLGEKLKDIKDIDSIDDTKLLQMFRSLNFNILQLTRDNLLTQQMVNFLTHIIVNNK